SDHRRDLPPNLVASTRPHHLHRRTVTDLEHPSTGLHRPPHRDTTTHLGTSLRRPHRTRPRGPIRHPNTRQRHPRRHRRSRTTHWIPHKISFQLILASSR